MILVTIRFINLLMAALVAGTVFGISIGFNPKSLSAAGYLEMQQMSIRSLNTLMPVLGLITIIITVSSAFLHKQETSVLIILLTAAFFMIITGLITRFGNQPINSIVIGWSKEAIPSNWVYLRDKWWTLHLFRTSTALISLSLIIFAYLNRQQ